MRFDNNLESQIIILDRGDYTSCTVNLHGATVTSWRIMNKEMLFVSRQAHFTGLSYIRGGIQFVFPVMGEWKIGPRHGFARSLPWTLLTPPVKMENGDVYAEISLCDNPYTRSLWNYKFMLYYRITLCEKKLMFHIGVENSSDKYPFNFNIMQHSLLRVPNVEKCEVTGFKNCRYKDCLRNNEIHMEDREKVIISGQTDRTYLNAPNQVELHNAVNGGTMRITKKRTYDVNLWNPWIEQSINRIEDLDIDEYQKFIAIEAGIVSKHFRLEPFSCWEAYQTFEFIEPRRQKPVGYLDDIFNYYC